MARAKVKEYYDELYGVRILCVIGCSHDKMLKIVGKKHPLICLAEIDRDVQSVGITYMLGDIHVVWVEKPDDFPTLLHETLHLAFNIFYDLSIDIDLKGNNEPFVYYYEQLMSHFFNDLMAR